MAQVPESTLPTVQESANPTPTQQIQAPAAAFAPAVAGQGLQEVGAAANQNSDQLHAYATSLQKLYTDQLADSKGLTAAAEGAKFTADWKTNNTLGNAVANYDAYQKGMEDIRNKAREGLGVYGSQMYDQLSRRYMVSDLTSTANYVATQGHENIVQTAKANVSTAGQLYLASPTPENEQLFLEAAGKATGQIMQSSGAPSDDPKVVQQLHEFISPVYRDAIQAKHDSGDLAGANAMYAQHQKDLLPQDQAYTGRFLRTANAANNVQSDAEFAAHGGAWSPHGTLNAQDPQSIYTNGVQWAESRGQAGAVGPLTQYGHAYGSSQMLDATAEAMAQKIGVAWDPALMRAKTPEGLAYQNRLGEAYFQEGMEKYGGDVHKALEYYHGGPDESQWGPKTQGYADAVMAHLTGASHSSIQFPALAPPAANEDPNQYLATGEAQIISRAKLMYPNDPGMQNRIIASGNEILRRDVAPIAAQQKADFDNVAQWVSQNAIGDPAQVAAQFPGQWSSMRADYRDSIMRQTQFENRFMTPEKMNTIAALDGAYSQAQVDPRQTFLHTDIRSLNIPFEYQEKYIKLQQQVGQNAKSVDQTTQQALTSIPGKTAIQAMGLKPGTQQYLQFAGTLHEEIGIYREQHNGAAPNEADLAKLITSVTAKSGGFLGMGSAAGYQVTVPPTDAAQIKDAYAKTGRGVPTDAQVRAEYLIHHGGQ